MTLLTDTEQKKLLSEIYNTTTRTKIEAVLKKYNLDNIPAATLEQVQKLAEEQKKLHRKGRGVWDAIWQGLGVTKAVGDKLFKE